MTTTQSYIKEGIPPKETAFGRVPFLLTCDNATERVVGATTLRDIMAERHNQVWAQTVTGSRTVTATEGDG